MARLVSNLSRIAAQAPAAASAALLQTGADVFNIADQLVPVDSGELKASGGVVPETSEKVAIGYGAEHAKYQEFGTTKMAPQPFLGPAMEEAPGIMTVRLAEEMQRITS